jgi:DNA-binding CsgD family transcriptional regulator
VPAGRRLEALVLAANGCGNAVIARRMGISPTTVQRHLQDAYGLLGVSDRAHAVSVALVRGLIDPEEIRVPRALDAPLPPAEPSAPPLPRRTPAGPPVPPPDPAVAPAEPNAPKETA